MENNFSCESCYLFIYGHTVGSIYLHVSPVQVRPCKPLFLLHCQQSAGYCSCDVCPADATRQDTVRWHLQWWANPESNLNLKSQICKIWMLYMNLIAKYQIFTDLISISTITIYIYMPIFRLSIGRYTLYRHEILRNYYSSLQLLESNVKDIQQHHEIFTSL